MCGYHYQRGHRSSLTSYLYHKKGPHLLPRPGTFSFPGILRRLRRVAEVLERVLEGIGSPERHVPHQQRVGDLMEVVPHHSCPLIPLPYFMPIPRVFTNQVEGPATGQEKTLDLGLIS